MTDTEPVRLDLLSLARLIPRLIGYSPSAHVVVIAFTGSRLVVTACYDATDVDAADAAGPAEQTVSRLAAHADSVIAITWGLAELTAAHHLRAVRAACADARLIVRESARVLDGRIWVGRERGAGRHLPAPEDSPDLTTAYLAHAPAQPSRRHLAALWAPAGSLTPAEQVEPLDGAHVWRRLLAGEDLNPGEQAAALRMLTGSVRTRDVVVASFGALGAVDRWDDPIRPLAEVIAPALRDVPLSQPLEYLRRFVTACDPTYAAEPLAVAALLAWTSGNGAQAEICTAQALRLDRANRLAQLVRVAVTNGLRAPSTP